MDGTLCEYKYQPHELFAVPGYFRNLKPFHNVLTAVKQLITQEKELGLQIAALSSINFKEVPHAEREKIDWLQEHIPELDYIFLPWMENKSDYVKDLMPEDALLDDFNRNLHEWRGTSIKLVNNVNHRTESWTGHRIYYTDPPEKIFEEIKQVLLSVRGKHT
jgi:5'(3')-deoxyribonucleotidase